MREWRPNMFQEHLVDAPHAVVGDIIKPGVGFQVQWAIQRYYPVIRLKCVGSTWVLLAVREALRKALLHPINVSASFLNRGTGMLPHQFSPETILRPPCGWCGWSSDLHDRNRWLSALLFLHPSLFPWCKSARSFKIWCTWQRSTIMTGTGRYTVFSCIL